MIDAKNNSVSRRERLTQVVVEVGELVRVRLLGFQIPQLQPLADEVVDEAPAISDPPASAAPAASSTAGVLSSPALATSSSSSSGMLLHRKNDNREASSRSRQSIRRARPPPSPDRARRGTRNFGLASTRAQREIDPGIEGSALRAAAPEEVLQRRHVLMRDIAPVGAPRQRGQDPLARTAPRPPLVFGWQTKIRRRLGVSPTPVALKGPVRMISSMWGFPEKSIVSDELRT